MINLPYGYVLDADSYQYILGKPYTSINKKTQKEETTIQQPTYHPSIEKALESLCERLKRQTIANSSGDLKDAVRACQEVSNAFAEELRKLVGVTVTVEAAGLTHHMVREYYATDKN